MKYTIKLMVLLAILWSSAKAEAQNETSTNSILSKLYFPFDFGSSFSFQKSIKNGSLVKTGVEYRIKKEQGIFLRFNFDNRSNAFEILKNPITNVSQGEVNFNDYVVGAGYRFGKNKFKSFALMQAGITQYNFPRAIKLNEDYNIQSVKSNTAILKLTLGLEYYIAENAAFTLEICDVIHAKNPPFWNNKNHIFGISLGLTTTLF